MSAPVVRFVVAEDIAFIHALSQSRPYTAKWSMAALVEEVSRPDSIFLFASGGPSRGYALARVVERDCRLLDIASEFDGCGCGRALLEALTRAVQTRGCVKMTFEVSADNTRAHIFYAKAGAKVVGGRPKFYNGGADAVLMDLDIP